MAHTESKVDSDMLLQVKDLTTVFETEQGPLTAVDGASLDLRAHEVLGVIGESGSGKTQLSLSVMQLLAAAGSITGGSIVFEGRDLLTLSRRRLRRIRGNEISMIFQEPGVALDPLYTVGNQLVETIRQHRRVTRREARNRAETLLVDVGIGRPGEILQEFPQKLSGGMLQRVMIAMALSCEPKLLIADEPTTALDVTVQAQILELMRDIKNRYGTSILFITHDLGVIAEICDEVAVMYAGQVVERAPIQQLFDAPQHPYTQALIRSRPLVTDKKTRPLPSITGQVPTLTERPTGCPFHPRCSEAMEVCRVAMPPRHTFAPRRETRCWLHEPERDRHTVVEREAMFRGSTVNE